MDRPAPRPSARRAALRTAALALALTAGCAGHGTPEQVARACEHQLSLSTRAAAAARLAREAAPDGPRRSAPTPPDPATLAAAVAARLATPATQQSLERCRALYAELPVARLDCVLAARDPVAVNACMPQADRQRR